LLWKSVCFSMCAGSASWCHLSAKSCAISTNGTIRSEASRLLISQGFLPRSGTNRRSRHTLRNKSFSQSEWHHRRPTRAFVLLAGRSPNRPPAGAALRGRVPSPASSCRATAAPVALPPTSANRGR
jgi:hypothetical protein